MKIITLTLSPAFDIHSYGEEFIRDHENIATVTARDAGGKGINISRALAVFGIENVAVAVLGEENGEDFARAVRSDDIDLLPIFDKGRIRENITVHTKNGKETRLSFTSTPVSDGILNKVEEKIKKLITGDTVLTVTGRIPDGIKVSDVKVMIKRFSELGVKTVVDSRSFSLSDLIDIKPYLIKPNEEEIAVYMQRPVTDVKEATEAAKELYAKGIENVMVSLGEKGAVLASRDGIFHAVAPKILPVSTIGAGDSSIAGFLTGISIGENTENALRRAVAFGTSACLTEGTRPPKTCDVENIIKEVTVNKID